MSRLAVFVCLIWFAILGCLLGRAWAQESGGGTDNNYCSGSFSWNANCLLGYMGTQAVDCFITSNCTFAECGQLVGSNCYAQTGICTGIPYALDAFNNCAGMPIGTSCTSGLPSCAP